jgi:hypothetical protein
MGHFREVRKFLSSSSVSKVDGIPPLVYDIVSINGVATGAIDGLQQSTQEFLADNLET